MFRNSIFVSYNFVNRNRTKREKITPCIKIQMILFSAKSHVPKRNSNKQDVCIWSQLLDSDEIETNYLKDIYVYDSTFEYYYCIRA